MVKLNVPKAEKQVITLKPSDTVIELAEEIAERADRIHDGNVDPHIDNMLKITSDGKKLALDPRCFVPESHDEEGSKLNECAERIYEGKVYWLQYTGGDVCKVYDCCVNQKELPDCGKCDHLPCERFTKDPTISEEQNEENLKKMLGRLKG